MHSTVEMVRVQGYLRWVIRSVSWLRRTVMWGWSQHPRSRAISKIQWTGLNAIALSTYAIKSWDISKQTIPILVDFYVPVLGTTYNHQFCNYQQL